mgnify:CR=1 FL=1
MDNTFTLDDALNFEEIFSDATFTGIKNSIEMFLKKLGASSTSMEFKDKTVLLGAHNGIVELHIVPGENKERPLMDGTNPEDSDE